MANTYTQMYVQIVFSVQGRTNIISERFRDELEKYICGIVSANKCKPLAIYCNPDHSHVFVGIHPTISVSKITEQIKSGSSNWINERKFIVGKFNWQDGYGAFTYSKSQVDNVVKYIQNQPEHHKKQTFREEYLLLLEKFEIDYDTKYLFEWYEKD